MELHELPGVVEDRRAGVVARRQPCRDPREELVDIAARLLGERLDLLRADPHPLGPAFLFRRRRGGDAVAEEDRHHPGDSQKKQEDHHPLREPADRRAVKQGEPQSITSR